MTPDHRLHRVAAGQLGLFTLAQALEAGFSERHLRHHTEAGRFERIGRGVYSMPGRGQSWERRLLAAVLTVGRGAVVSHLAAAHLLGFDGFGAGPIELTVPRGRRARTSLAVIHTTVSLPRLDIVTVGRFRATSGARTIIDLSTRLNEERLTAAIGSAVRDGWTSEPFLDRRLREFRGYAGTRSLVAVLDGPIGHSHLERRFLRLVRDAHLPPPRTQITYRGDRVMRVDAVWQHEWVVVEVMGHRFHCTALDLQRDAQRRIELQDLGFEVLEFATVDVARRPAYVTGRLARTLSRRRDAFAQLASLSVTRRGETGVSRA